jgi:hypothetical protein
MTVLQTSSEANEVYFISAAKKPMRYLMLVRIKKQGNMTKIVIHLA